MNEPAVVKREKVKELDFTRTLAVLGVIIAHFSSANLKGFPNTEFNNLSLSSLSVACFLIISGFSMFYNHDEISDYKRYYIKQWKRIFPAYYVVWLIFFLDKAFQKGAFLYNGGVSSIPYIFLTVIGLDGYLLFVFPKAYYITGEWFLGAILILRLIFPLLLSVKKKKLYEIIVVVSTVVLYILSFLFPITSMYRLRTIPYCLLCFMIGYGIQKFSFWKKRLIVLLSAVCFLILLLFKLPYLKIEVYTPLAATCLVLFSLGIGRIICNNSVVYRTSAAISRLSYNIFLLQHIIIYKVFSSDSFRGMGRKGLCFLLLLTFIIICACARGLEIIMNESKLFRKDKIIKQE